MDDGRSAATDRGTILVIDDEEYVAQVIAAALQLEGYTVHMAHNGREGFKQAVATCPDLIIMDLMMPYMNGEHLAGEIRAHDGLGDVPIVLISAGASPSGAVPDATFVAKPFEIEELLDAVATRLDQ